jgi:lauroyl/myristoyl acyltransferase
MTALARLWFVALRGAERALPPAVLRALLWPGAAVWAWSDRVLRTKFSRKWRQIPVAIRGRALSPREFRRARTRLLLSQCVALWPDRLATPRWQARIRYEGMARLESALDSGVPVVLPTLHFSALWLLRYLLRARGIAVSVLVAQPRERRTRLQRMRDALMATEGIPEVCTLEELAAARRFLVPGHCLLVAMDVGRGRQVRVDTPYGTMRLATGAMRLASSSGAMMLPCLVEEAAPWRFVVRLGEVIKPVPGLDFEAAARRMVEGWLPVVARRPTHWHRCLIECWEPPDGEPARRSAGG